ncbi:MAG TPA: HAD-IIIC family phosphatase [Acidimicrobiia bacterium]|nr:HAD-IIIC family phosphatase [Acidimicrobiia bacterium]
MFVLASFTFDLLVPYLLVECARRGLDAAVETGPFNQLEQLVLDRESALWTAAPDVVIVAPRLEDLAPELDAQFLSTATDAAIDGYVSRIVGLVRALRTDSAARVVLWNQAPPQRLVAGLADVALEHGQQYAVAELDRRLARACTSIPGVIMLDVARLASELGTRQWYDAKLQALARVPLTAAAQIAVAARTARTLRAMRRAPAKCLVLDLDNTLWGGVLGEDGLAGIALGEDYPGSVYKTFQRVLRGYRDRGVLLAIASKNNATDVDELFASHRDMVLTRDDFAAMQIHWNDKASSLRTIAAELEIGIDSLVFFDDSPVERAWVRDQLPEVTVVDVPGDPVGYVAALDDCGAFDHLVVTAEDRQRAEQYIQQRERVALEHSTGSVEEFLHALQMTATIGRLDTATLPRAAQLLAKTNQFNVTTRRHDEAALQAMLARDGAIALWMRVADRYGDNGLVALAIALPSPASDAYVLDSFLMSCRVLGRSVENALLWSVARRARSHATALLGEWIPTKKNKPAAGFFASTGFVPDGERPNCWRLDLTQLAPPALAFELFEES